MKRCRAILACLLLVLVAVASPIAAEPARAQEEEEGSANVVGGHPAADSEFPYLAAVLFDGYQGCGAALIAASWAVSSAHCFLGEPADSIYIGLGSSNLQQMQFVAVKRVIPHPAFVQDTFAAATNDIALLQLVEPVDLSGPNISVIPIRADDPPLTSEGPLTVVGWGDSDPGVAFDPTTVARTAEVQAIPCEIFGDDAVRLCTSDADGDGACTNDSGGPLVTGHPDAAALVALVEATTNETNGTPLCGSNTIVLHQRVGPHIAWMQSVTGEVLGGTPAKCNDKTVTINMNTNGGNGMGTAFDDVILGTLGDDIIDGLGGDDTICALDGRDRVSGGLGNDTVFGGFGIDYIYGEAGNDVLDGDGGSDRMWGGADDDLMLGDSGADRMFGGAGNDEMRGMGGQDFMWGEGGDDLMQGNFQTDNMWGGSGNDDMFGAGGKDSLFGEAGNDDLFGGNNTDYLDGGDGTDTANGGRGRDKPLVAPGTRASNGQLFGGSGCIAETILNCQPAP